MLENFKYRSYSKKKNEYIVLDGQMFTVIAVEFDLNELYEQYNIYIS